MNYQKLYKRTSSGKIQEWEISTEENKIITIQGQTDGKKQRYEEIIKEGKNTGKVNETTPEQQAQAEAQSKWERKHNKDYHLTIEKCNTTVKIANRGGYLPMLAQSYKKHGERHLKYSCYIQPKLDGLRMISTKGKTGVKLWFRSGKEIITMPHIVVELDKIMKIGDIFDGEAYTHKEDFNSFTGAIRANKNLNPDIIQKVQYHIYDFPRINGLTENIPYEKRLKEFKTLKIIDPIISVDTIKVSTFEEAMLYYSKCIEKGYEGIMFRNIDMPYIQSRSYNLLKYKEFVDDEFIIIGAEEGKGILAGHVGSFVCKIEAGRVLKDIGGKEVKFGGIEGQIKAKMDGKQSLLKHLFENPKEYMGKFLTIKYQNLSKGLIPRFPIGLTIRFDI